MGLGGFRLEIVVEVGADKRETEGIALPQGQ